jgi:PAS domain S-box-containing protein
MSSDDRKETPDESIRDLQAALDESEQRYRNLFENSVLGVYRTTPDGRVLMANPALLRMLGYSSLDELMARDLEHGDFEPRYSRARFKEKIEVEEEIIGLESVWIKRDGTALFVRENARVIRSSDGNPLYYEGTVEDISERKRAEEKLRALLSELSRVAERDRLRTAGRVNEHMYNVLVELADLLERDDTDAGDARVLVEQVARCLIVVRDEIDPPCLDEVSLESAIEGLVERQRSLRGMEFEFRDDRRPKPLEEDVGNLLLTAVRGLLLNAVMHSGARRVVLEVSKVEANVQIVCRDDGQGFDPARLDNGSAPSLEGLRERVEAIGGAMEIDSGQGRGTRVVLIAPLGLAY